MLIQHKQQSTTSHRAKAHRPRPVRSHHALNPRCGFTLVEMMVSVALVVLMMSLFASVFQLAAGSIGVQRGIAENDQRARSFFTIIRNDLKARSMQSVLPFTANETAPSAYDANFSVTNFDLRRGYFFISENDPNNDADDILQYTVELDGTNRDYFGQAALLGGLTTNSDFMDSNQPSRDDGVPAIDGDPDITGDPVKHDSASNAFAAEISYFLRGSRLYRRVLLIRKPLETSDNTQPETTAGKNYFDTDPDNNMDPAPAYAFKGEFWRDFDFSAHMDEDGSNIDGAKFHGISDLDNGSSAATRTGPAALANPKNRFGHNHNDGLPREFVLTDLGADNQLGGTGNDADTYMRIGRYTHEETSHVNFNYPQAYSYSVPGDNTFNPMSDVLLPMSNDVVTEFRHNAVSRRAEDLLLSNVHAFDIKVWDDALGRFEDVGHNVENSGAAIGDFNLNKRTNTSYGPADPAIKRVFDTWHPSINIDDTPGTVDAPPFNLQGGGVPKPLKAIQITIRYLDISSDQLRQVTLQISLQPGE